MSEAQVEQRQQNGTVLLVLVGLGIAFALLVALLAAAKAHTGPIYGEANMLYAALVLYAGAATLYMGYGVTGIERYVNSATVLTAVGFLANTAAVAHRWSVAGRPPFSNMYEMLLSFVWTLALLTLIAERAYKVKIIGSITMPITVVSVILMQLLPSEVRPLVPALAVHLAAGARLAGHAQLRGLRRQLCPGHHVPRTGRHEERELPGADQHRNDRHLRRHAVYPLPRWRP